MSAQTQLAVVQEPALKLTAAEVKDALRRRHPALWPGNVETPGAWTCLEEWMNVDLLAFGVWAGALRIGYEVKVSRSDYRRELLAPAKRALAVAFCHEFYFAVPAGLLNDEERAWQEPDNFDPVTRCGENPALDAAPYLWIPPDVGLMVVEPWGGSTRCRVLRAAPSHEPTYALSQRNLGELVRWASARPDPRHASMKESQP